VEWQRKNGERGYGVRFYDADGVRHYERCGLESEGWSRRRAEIELENFVRLVEAGAYVPAPDARPSQEQDPLFGAFARAFLAEHAVEIKPKTREFYENLLEQHLAPYFEKQRLTQISWSSIDAYKKQRLMLMQRIQAARASGNPLRDGNLQPLRLSERTINHSIELLALILDEGVRRPDIALVAHPARDKKLRIKVPKKDVRDWLEPDEILSLLDAAEVIDSPVRPETLRKANEVRRLRDEKKLTIKEIAAELRMSEGGVCWLYERRCTRVPSARRAIIATLAASGTRNTELCGLRWDDLDFQHGKIRIRQSKTARGVREVDMTPWLRDELLAYKASRELVSAQAPAFPTTTGGFRDKDNLNRRVIGPVERAARELRADRGLPPLPAKLSAHVFRRTYITLMAEAGAPITYVQDQVGHESARLTLEIYARVSRSRDRAKWGRAFDELMSGAVPPELGSDAQLRLPDLADLDTSEAADETA
jgi:integrase